MAARVHSYDSYALRECAHKVALLYSKEATNFSINDADDLLTYVRINTMTHEGFTLGRIAKGHKLSITTIVNRRRRGARQAMRLVSLLIKRYDGEMSKVTEVFSAIIGRDINETDRFLKNFAVDYQHDAGADLSFSSSIAFAFGDRTGRKVIL